MSCIHKHIPHLFIVIFIVTSFSIKIACTCCNVNSYIHFSTNTLLFGKLITKPRLHFRLRFLQIVIKGGIIMMYTIGQVSQMFDIPISTLRYYDKEGLFPDIQRTSGIRRFGEKELEAIRVIECLKKSVRLF